MGTSELSRKRAAILKESRAILERAVAQKRDLTTMELASWEAKMAEAKRLLEDIKNEEAFRSGGQAALLRRKQELSERR